MRALVVALGAFAGACSFESLSLPARDAGGATIDREPPGGREDAGVEVDAARECVASCVSTSTLHTCPDDVDVSCDLGCIPETGEAHCARVAPSNGVSGDWLDAATAELTVPAAQTVVFDTDTGEIVQCGVGTLRPPGVGLDTGIRFEVATPGGARELGTFALRRIQVAGGATLRAVGTRGFALLLDRDLILSGVIDVSGGGKACDLDSACLPAPGNRRCGGPGGGDGGGVSEAGDLPGGGGLGGGGSPAYERGGGGGGHGASGGAGGANGGAGGTPFGDVDMISGGGGGGGGGMDANGGEAGFGGGGGGAVQITANGRIVITETPGTPAGVNAGGAGGGYATGTNGAGGGGAGGAVLLEGSTVEITLARVTANGGGGGATPGNPPSGTATEGTAGSFSAVPAPGGTGINAGGMGGTGSSGGAGAPTGVEADAGAGGGGGTGRIALRARTGGIILLTPTISPAPSQGTIRVE